MKKELIAAILLILILTGCIINSRIITSFTGELAGLVNSAGREAGRGEWETAGRYIDEAFELMERRRLYLGVFLPIDDTERITDSLDQLMGQIHSRNAAGIPSAVHLAVSRLISISRREQASLGSIF